MFEGGIGSLEFLIVSAQLTQRRASVHRTIGSIRRTHSGRFEMKRQQNADIVTDAPLRQFGEDVAEVSVRFDIAGTASEHNAVDDRDLPRDFRAKNNLRR